MDERARLQGLLARARSGDSSAIERLIEEFGPEIQRELRCCLRRNPLRLLTGPSDIFQSVIGRFLLLLQRQGHDLDDPVNLKNLLKAMVQNRITDLGRFHGAARRDYRRTVRPDPDSTLEPISAEPTPCAIARRAEWEAASRNLHRDILGRLSAESRLVLQLREQGLGWPEVAQRVNNGGPEAVRKRYERDLALVRDQVLAHAPRAALEALDLAPSQSRPSRTADEVAPPSRPVHGPTLKLLREPPK